MNKKLVLLVITIIIFITSCSYIKDAQPKEDELEIEESETKENQPPLKNNDKDKVTKKDRLAKTNKKFVEENINGFDVEDDLQITQIAKNNNKKNQVSSLSQNQKDKDFKNVGSKKINTVLEEYNTQLPEGVNNTVQYFEYDITFDYFLITNEEGTKVYEKPSSEDSTVIDELNNLDKVSLLQRVEAQELNGSTIWYRVAYNKDKQTNEGYIHSTFGTPRKFRFSKMKEAVNGLVNQLGQGELHFISNYKNINGTPPEKGEAALDEFGYRSYHSAPAYEKEDINSDFRYIPDGILVRIIDESNEFFHISVPSFGGNYFVPKKYINSDVTLNQLTKVIVVDRVEQNQAAFELVGNGMNLVSYTLSTTGVPGNYSFETTLGSYKTIEKKERFEYLKKGTQETAGYAPFAIRFTGGAYIHGVPVSYKEQNGEKIDPGYIEYLHTIGTFPRSSMCVRNYTSHAEFLYNWIDIPSGAVIVIE